MAKDNKMGVLLRVGLNTSTTQIKKDLVKIQTELNKYSVTLKTSLGDTKKASTSTTESTKKETAARRELNEVIKVGADKTTILYDANNKAIKATQEFAKSVNITETAVRNLNNEKLDTLTVTDKTNANQKVLNKSIDTFAKKLEIAKIQAKATAEQATKFGNSLSHEKVKKYNTEIQKMAVKTDMSEDQLREMNQQLKVSQARLNATAKEAKSLGNNSMSFGNMMETAFKKFAIWMTATSIFFGLQQAVKAAIKTVSELDLALVELNKVADLTNSELTSITKQAYAVGDAIGALGVDVISATADFARMGYTANEALDLAEEAIVLKNIGDGIDSVSEASSTMISVMKGFGMETENSMRILDSMNEVSNNYAVTTQDLAEGLRNSSATMSQSGTSMEETIAILTAGNEVMQNMSKTSTGLVTISQRLRGLSEAAEDGEDFTNFTAKLQDAFKNIADVDIMDDGKLRSTYDIMVDMAEAQKNLSAEQMQYLGELAAGMSKSLYVQKCA